MNHLSSDEDSNVFNMSSHLPEPLSTINFSFGSVAVPISDIAVGKMLSLGG